MYLVFVCPKCQLSAQILEPGHKTVSCYRCNSKIQTAGLRYFGSFETREDAISMRSIIQAQICSSADGLPVNLAGVLSDRSAAEMKTSPPKAKKPQQVIADVLRANGTMIVADCEYYCAERGVDSAAFQKTLQKMIEAGIVYRPDKGLIALVP